MTPFRGCCVSIKGGLSLQRLIAILLVCAFVLTAAYGQSQSGANVRIDNVSGQLLVQGKPFLILGGELGNSSAGTSAQADTILPKMARLHLNTVLMPIAWEQAEPREGSFDFSILDHWIDVARQQNLHLVLLWFGSWKNAFSEYAPDWVKSDTKRFPRAKAADGTPLEILSTFGTDNAKCDVAGDRMFFFPRAPDIQSPCEVALLSVAAMFNG